MPVEGLRAWIGEVERKLGKRTRVFLALAVIAIGIGGAAIYLAIDARDSSVSESDVQALQEDLEARIGTGGAAAGGDVARLEAELATLRGQVEQLRGGGGAGQGKGGGAQSGGTGGADKGSSSGSGASSGASSNGGGDDTSGGGAGSATSGSSGRLQELLEKAKEQNAQAEAEQAGK